MGNEILKKFLEVKKKDQLKIESNIDKWDYQEKGENLNSADFLNFNNYNGPEDLLQWWNWGVPNNKDKIKDKRINEFIERNIEFDTKIAKEINSGFKFDNRYLNGIARNNAQDYFVSNSYPFLTGAEVILDFGSGCGRQAFAYKEFNKINENVFISIDAIPKNYCIQNFYYKKFNCKVFEYISGDGINLENRMPGIYHIPTWRMDLIPDNLVDKILANQVLTELSPDVISSVLKEFSRITHQDSRLYVRDHKIIYKNDKEIDHLINKYFIKEYELLENDKDEFWGIPRIYKKRDKTNKYKSVGGYSNYAMRKINKTKNYIKEKIRNRIRIEKRFL